jgi:hypothetical protein
MTEFLYKAIQVCGICTVSKGFGVTKNVTAAVESFSKEHCPQVWEMATPPPLLIGCTYLDDFFMLMKFTLHY